MSQYELIRTNYYLYKKSIREIAGITGHSRQTIRKVLKGIYPSYTQVKGRDSPVLGNYKDKIREWVLLDQTKPRKQRHTGLRIYHRLVEECGYNGGESTVRHYVTSLKRELGITSRESFLPLEQTFGEGEIDWGEAKAIINGLMTNIHVFSFRLQGSGAIFVRCYLSENLESFLDGHVKGFEFFGGVIPIIRYDNLKTAIQKVLKGKLRNEQEKFINFRHYYSFKGIFCNVAKGNEKGGVEGIVGYSRRNFLVPIPEFDSIEELNDKLIEKCLSYQSRTVGDRKLPVKALFIKENLIPLPKDAYPYFRYKTVKADHYSTVKFENNRYSVPTEYSYQSLDLRASAFRVEIFYRNSKIAEHQRSYNKDQWVIDPVHYLDLLMKKVGGFDRSRPINQIKQQWPSIYQLYLKKLINRLGEEAGKREFIKTLMLRKKYSLPELTTAVELVIEMGSVSADMVSHLIRWSNQNEQKVLPMNLKSELERIKVNPSLEHFSQLLGG